MRSVRVRGMIIIVITKEIETFIFKCHYIELIKGSDTFKSHSTTKACDDFREDKGSIGLLIAS